MKNKHRKAGEARGYLDSLVIRGEELASFLSRRSKPPQVTLERIMRLVEMAQNYEHTMKNSIGVVVKGDSDGTEIEYFVKPKDDGSPTFIYDDELIICTNTGCY